MRCAATTSYVAVKLPQEFIGDLHSKSDADWIKIKGARGDVLYTVFDDF